MAYLAQSFSKFYFACMGSRLSTPSLFGTTERCQIQPLDLGDPQDNRHTKLKIGNPLRLHCSWTWRSTPLTNSSIHFQSPWNCLYPELNKTTAGPTVHHVQSFKVGHKGCNLMKNKGTNTMLKKKTPSRNHYACVPVFTKPLPPWPTPKSCISQIIMRTAIILSPTFRQFNGLQIKQFFKLLALMIMNRL